MAIAIWYYDHVIVGCASDQIETIYVLHKGQLCFENIVYDYADSGLLVKKDAAYD